MTMAVRAYERFPTEDSPQACSISKMKIEREPVASAIVALVERERFVEMNAGRLLRRLREVAPDATADALWPRTPEGMTWAVKRFKRDLGEHGIDCTLLPRTVTGRKWRLALKDAPADALLPGLNRETLADIFDLLSVLLREGSGGRR